MFGGVFEGLGDAFPGDDAHAAAEEAEVQGDEHDGAPADFAATGEGGFTERGAAEGFAELAAVVAAVGKGEGVGGGGGGVGFVKGAWVGQKSDAGPGADGVVVAAVVADAVGAEIGHGLGGGVAEDAGVLIGKGVGHVGFGRAPSGDEVGQCSHGGAPGALGARSDLCVR